MPQRVRSRSRSEHRLERAAYKLSAVLVVVLGCDSHANPKIQVNDADCASCHADERDDAVEPPHALLKFAADCGECHDQRVWSEAPGFAHSALFPLTLGHEDSSCGTCHGAGYEPDQIQRECVECHGESAERVKDPIHAGLTTDCFACHRTDVFFPARFVHSWPLTGVHTTTECRACHLGNPATYEGTSTLCISCHREDRVSADRDSVEHAAYPDACQGCHGADTWAVP